VGTADLAPRIKGSKVSKPVPSVVVIGAGIVGLACAYGLRSDGYDVTVIDRDPEGDKASFGNAGGIAVIEVIPASVPGLAWRVPGWLLNPLGPLAVRPAHAARLIPWLWRFAQAGRPREVARISQALAALNGRVFDDLLPMLRNTGLSDELHRSGALSVYETDAGFHRDAGEWQVRRSLGIVAEDMTGEAARNLEPALGPLVRHAVFTPQWAHVSDPKLIVEGVRRWLLTNGVAIIAGEVSDISGGAAVSLALSDGRTLRFGHAVVAAGAWSGLLAARIGDRVVMESERGYNTTIPDSGVALGRQMIFAERKFVATPLACGLRIGGAAEFGGLVAAPNYRRSRALVALAKRYLPNLRATGGTEWMGHRPATPDSLPVIGRSPRRPNIFYAFGHGHLGLTQAATTGRLITDLLGGKSSPIDIAPYDIRRFDGAKLASPPS
jgi:glycine/D-amino acid oxidase-like deaminating enzyme